MENERENGRLCVKVKKVKLLQRRETVTVHSDPRKIIDFVDCVLEKRSS